MRRLSWRLWSTRCEILCGTNVLWAYFGSSYATDHVRKDLIPTLARGSQGVPNSINYVLLYLQVWAAGKRERMMQEIALKAEEDARALETAER